MVDASLVLNPITIFLAAILVAFLLYLWGRYLAPLPHPTGHKREMYTGGEAPKEQELQPSYRFFHIALFFTVLHVAVIVLVTAPGGTPGLLALLYLAVISIAVAALIWRK